MSTIGTYTFLPWLRQGIANRITAADGAPGVKLRATVKIDLELRGDKLDGGTDVRPISRDIQLYGPGDIVGLDTKAIIKTEPRNWITNFETNYLPYIDFYDEDLPWRYTPAAADAAQHRLRPWITLVVLKEDEFQDGKNIKDKPLPFIEVADAATLFPPADQLWAWAHVHINRPLDTPITSTDTTKVLTAFQATLNENPDLAYARILCPRRLQANTAYHAFVVPTFETGRLAGLGLDPEGAPNATASAWAAYDGREAPTQYPVYHRWYFRTGTIGDFEYLVRLLEPKPVDSRVGRRDMDVQNPGANLPGISKPELGGILKLGGALKIPFDTLGEDDKQDVLKYDNWAQPYPQDFQVKLAEFINLSDEYAEKTAQQAHDDTSLDLPPPDPGDPDDPDPLITPPLYGRWHALTERLLTQRDGSPANPDDNWVHELNLDPRWRVAAGFGTGVVQQNQEKYMDAAWGQLGDVLEANRRIRQAQLAKEVSWMYYDRHLRPLLTANAERLFTLTTPLQKRVTAQGLTVYHQVHTSRLTRAATAVPLRKVMRPRGRVARILPFDGAVRPDNLIGRINAGEVTATPPKVVPDGVPTVNDVAEGLLPGNAPGFLVDWLRRHPWLRFLPLILILVVLIIVLILSLTGVGIGIGAAIIAGLLLLYRYLAQLARRVDAADSVSEDRQTPESVDRLPRSPDFRLADLNDSFSPATGNTDSTVAIRFKGALRDAYRLIQKSEETGIKPERRPVDLARLTTATFTAIDPDRTVPARVWGNVLLPGRLIDLIGEEFKEAMAYPEFDLPMYRPLVDISSELFLPNINFIEQNSISLLETNQKFIEAYMVGLNHEFARELLWREYPTDQRGSYFRQFWDVSTFFDTRNLNNEELRERLRDIPPLDRWSKFSELGDHDHREQQGDKEEEVVLVIRGELLKKYPTAVIYAHRARWQTKEGSSEIDKAKPRDLVELTPAEEANPPREKVRTPLYEAKVDPDIYFFGFDLTAIEARGETEDDPDDPGWFFVIKERPGEPRFGLDIDQTDTPHFWNDLSWPDVGTAEGASLQIANLTDFSLTAPPAGLFPGSDVQHSEDVNVHWAADTNAAELAYILYQVPVLVAVHAAEMLP